MEELDLNRPAKVYFMGIGGVSMSELALHLKARGFTVTGSDGVRSSVTEMLESKGITVYSPQQAGNITDHEKPDFIVYTAAIHPDNPEMKAAEELDIPLYTRAGLLGQVMKAYGMPVAVAGTHGKTTTTSMLSEMALMAGLDPTLFIGGVLPSVGGGYRDGKAELLIAEACEYTNSFLEFHPGVGVILNIDADHLDFFKDIEDIRRSFRKFAGRIPDDGVLIINNSLDRLQEFLEGITCRVVTFGVDDGEGFISGGAKAPDPGVGTLSGDESETRVADYRAVDITYDEAARASYTLLSPGHPPMKVTLGVPGAHNVSNSLAAVAAFDLTGADREKAAEALKAFTGAQRRLEYKGERDGIKVIDDYAHHPTEIRASLETAMKYEKNELWVIFQPHTYSRTKALLEDFADALSIADHVVLPDIYAAREARDPEVSSELLSERIREKGGDAVYKGGLSEASRYVRDKAVPGDIVITMGAGDVWKCIEEVLAGSAKRE